MLLHVSMCHGHLEVPRMNILQTLAPPFFRLSLQPGPFFTSAGVKANPLGQARGVKGIRGPESAGEAGTLQASE